MLPPSPRTSLSLVLDVLFPEGYALHDPLAMPKSCKCNPSYVVRQPIILQCIDILFHHYQLLAATSTNGSVRTHTHRISKSVQQSAIAIDGSGMRRLTAQVWSIWAKLHAIHQFQDPVDCSIFTLLTAATSRRTFSPKRLLTRPLNGWKPESRIFSLIRAGLEPCIG